MSERKYQVCSRCVMDTTDTDIQFDEHGVCQRCREYEERILPDWNHGKGHEAELQELIAKIKKSGEGKKYDCILGLSGGLDSTYMLHLADDDIDNVNGKTAFDAQQAGDNTGKEVVEKYIEYLATGLINVINIFQPDVLCIGGGIAGQGENLLAPLRTIIEAERFTKFNEKQTKVCIASLGNDAGIIGAACL